MREKLQSILDTFSTDAIEEGEALDELIQALGEGSKKDEELAEYFVSDETSSEGDDYLTDYQCIEIVVATYELTW